MKCSNLKWYISADVRSRSTLLSCQQPVWWFVSTMKTTTPSCGQCIAL